MASSIWKNPTQNRVDTLTKISRYRNEVYSSTTEVSFREFIHNKLKEREMTREGLAIALGYEEGEEAKRKAQTLKHTIGKKGYTTNRDRIIAICIALEMSHPDTDKALFLYGMLPLSDYDIRDILLIQALTDHCGLEETNQLLKESGLQPLEIEKTKQLPDSDVIREPYDEFKRISGPTYSYGDFVGDRSLSGMNNPGSYSFDGEMILQDENGVLYTIEASDGGTYMVTQEKADGSCLGIKVYRSMSECMNGRFNKYFLELEDGIRRKAKSVLFTMDDTRNYMMRFDAEVKNGQLNLFVEAFNYDCPEYSEYYQMERLNGEYRMTVTHESMYMRHHLGEYYSSFFNRSHKINVIAEYTSVEGIQKSKETNRSSAYWKRERIKHFSKLQGALNQLISDLREKNIMINDPFSYTNDIYYDLAKFYDIQGLFTWEQNKGNGAMEPIEDSCIATTSNDSTVSITLNEMKRAFELGISSIDDFFLIKTQYGDIEGILR